ncbi:MAG: hypothetical protein J0L65_14900 [Xanthomonadales bacterium]|jgi:hypothetical protein|nr:hypothetical protein [Xanthomonadales bacterium]
MDTIPFHFDSHGGLGEVKGLARMDEYGLELQFSTRDALFGVIKSDLRSLRVPFDALLSVRYSAGFLWLMPSIQLRVRDLQVLAGLPESEEGRVTLRVKFGDRHDGRAFARDLDTLRSHYRVQMLDRTLDRMTRHQPGIEPPPAPLAPSRESPRREASSRPHSE